MTELPARPGRWYPSSLGPLKADVIPERGLTNAEAEARLAKYGA